MKIIHMIDAYRHLCADCRKEEKFEAYRAYTETYAIFFDAVFRYLYHCPVEALRRYIENVDFDRLLDVGEQNYARGVCDRIIAAADKTRSLLKTDFEFELMLGMELSNIGGCSVPRKDNVPYLYIGIDRELDNSFIDIFVPHEMYHMIRCQNAPRTENETLLSRTVEEGLASFVPMWLNDLEWNAESVSKLLGLQLHQSAYLIENTAQIVNDVIEHGAVPLNAQIMQKYFSLTDADAAPALTGYYAGLYLTYLSLRNGVDFEQFAAMPAEEIVDLWLKIWETIR